MTKTPAQKKLVLSTKTVQILQGSQPVRAHTVGPCTLGCRTSDAQLKQDIKKL